MLVPKEKGTNLMRFLHHHVKNPDSMFRIYFFTWLTTLVLYGVILVTMGPAALLPLTALVIIEVVFSFDNAVVNAKVLEKMSPMWQKIFMTVGIAVAVIGMRAVFPVVLVSLTAHLGFGEVIDLALNHPHVYAEHLETAHPQLAAFGGTFLFMIFLNFILEDKDIVWLRRLERPLIKVGKLDTVSVIVALFTLLTVASLWGGDHKEAVLFAGLLGLVVYLLVNAFDSVFENDEEDESSNGSQLAKNAAKAGFFSFLYLEMLDASFSFDGVVGAFALTDKVLLITAGLGIGAVHVRSLTVHVIRHQTLTKYRFLEHGAHWAIGALALCVLLSLRFEIPEWVTGSLSVGFITAAFISSRRHTKKNPPTPEVDEPNDGNHAVPSSTPLHVA